MTKIGQDSLTAALSWISSLATGSMASVAAVLAVSGLGLAMMAGRLPWRRGVEVVLGTFLIFGASSIAQGLAGQRVPAAQDVAASRAPAVTVRVPPPAVYDPYAGASVPRARSSSDLLSSGQ